MNKTIELNNEEETIALATSLARVSLSYPGLKIFLRGDLGSGKTTFVRGFLRGLNFKGSVKSPTFTLVEEYDFAWGPLYHFDLYRLSHPEELEFIGIREYFAEAAIVLVEWPEQGKGVLKEPDIQLHFTITGNGVSRQVLVEGLSSRGKAVVVATVEDLLKR